MAHNAYHKSLLLLLLCTLPLCAAARQPKPRVLISTDIGGTDPDDNQSMAHLLMYSDMVDIEGLVSSPSFGDGDKSEILRMIDLYEQDYTRLAAHCPELTPPDSLRPLAKQGVRNLAPLKGFTSSTEGSDWIIECARRPDRRPLWVLVWGTLDDVAQALHDAPDIADRIKVYFIGGPNKKWGVNSYDYIARNFPDLWMIENNSSYRGFISDVKLQDHYNSGYYDDAIRGAGHLGADFKRYYDGIVKMGDSPSLFYLIDNRPDDPSSSSWGGRFEPTCHTPRFHLSPRQGDHDTVNVYSVVELSVESTDPSDSLTLIIDKQKWPGERVSPDRLTVRYSPKQTATLPYHLVVGADTISATLEIDNIWPGDNSADSYQLGSNWYTDISNPGFFIGKWQGAETVASARKNVLDHWQQRWEWLKDSVTHPTPAFPGAEGFGKYASGGRGGKVYHVTTLADGNQPGTLRHAAMQPGRRTVVFDVAGTIMLDSPLRITEGDLTIAGQSAPGDGICIAGYPVVLKGDNTIVRYLRLRVGDLHSGDHDGIGGTDFKNLILDHCSVSWSVDECCGLYGGEDFTVQWCIFSEPLRNSGHSKGAHGYGAIFGGSRASYHHNLIAHSESRTPRIGPRPGTQTREHLDMRNNVIYNWAGSGCYGGEGMLANIVNNYYKPGPATPTEGPVAHRIFCPGVRTVSYVTRRDGSLNQWAPMLHRWGEFFIDGNVMEGNPDVTADNWTDGVINQIDRLGNDGTFTPEAESFIRLSDPVASAGITTESAADAFQSVLRHAGCSHRRDAIDSRIVDETRSGSASLIGSRAEDAADKPGFIDSQTDAIPRGKSSPWPPLKATKDELKAVRDTDGDGIPDEWELIHGLDPADPSDGPTTTPCGYTNLEIYLNSLI